jgi:hypothetical protein
LYQYTNPFEVEADHLKCNSRSSETQDLFTTHLSIFNLVATLPRVTFDPFFSSVGSSTDPAETLLHAIDPPDTHAHAVDGGVSLAVARRCFPHKRQPGRPGWPGWFIDHRSSGQYDRAHARSKGFWIEGGAVITAGKWR